MAAADPVLEALLDRLPVLQGLERTVVELPGGLTNQNLRVTTPHDDVVVRVFRGDAGLLGIDRDAEHENTRLAAAAGVGAAVVDYRRDLGVLVIRYLEGVTLTNDSFADPAVLRRAADACRRLHRGQPFRGDFDMFVRQATYRRTVAEHGYRLFADYDRFEPAWRRVEAVLSAREDTTVPCNNDLLAGNFVDDGDRTWLIDYEYSGNNDPCFELGNTATECELSPEQVEALVEAYDGRLTRHRLARVRLQSLVSQYGWSLWGAIQAGASTLDFDFWAWGQERFDKAARTFTSPELDSLLGDCARDD